MKLFAYIDPGTGSMFLQTILGVVLGGFVIFRRFFGKVIEKAKVVFARRRLSQDEE